MSMPKSKVAVCLFSCLASTAAFVPIVRADAGLAPAGAITVDPAWHVDDGVMTLAVDSEALAQFGMKVIAGAPAAHALDFVIDGYGSSFVLAPSDDGVDRLSGVIQTYGSTRIAVHPANGGDPLTVGNFALNFLDSAVKVADALDVHGFVFELAEGTVRSQFDPLAGSMNITGQLVITDAFARDVLDNPAAAGAHVGTVIVHADAVPADEGGADTRTACQGSTGPDVIVGDLTGPANYTASGGLDATSLGTTSCNLGTVWLNWIANTNQHPVIGGNLYRLKFETVGSGTYGKFEQVGMSWLKHGFFALSQNLCCANCQSTDGTHLGVGCSDPYTAERNGGQSGLGPRWQVNAATGFFTYPPANPSWSGSTARRLEVLLTDLEVTAGSTTKYFGEGHYVTPDDAAAGNKYNNASYRGVTVSGGPSNFSFAFTGSTQRELPAIAAWPLNESGVLLKSVDIANDGRIYCGSKATDLGNGMWHYEFAVYNMCSDRSGQAFEVTIGGCVTPTNIGFHDIDYRNGDGIGNVNQDGTDWPNTVQSGVIRWATQTHAQNQNANALRWGTLYNFRFDLPAPPQTGNVTLTLFKPGSPSSINLTAQVPTPGAGDPPAITQQPAAQVQCAGGIAMFSVTATGTPPLTYQWRLDGDNIPGATSSTLTIDPVTAGDAGMYDVVVTDACGQTDSDDVALTVWPTGTGDANTDGIVNADDVQGFVDALLGAGEPDESYCASDMDGNAAVQAADIPGFLDALLGL